MGRRRIAGKTVAVTGGAGFIGSHLCDRLLKKGAARLVIIDNFSLGKERNILQFGDRPAVKVYREDASNYSSMRTILKEHDVDIVFNLAVVPLPKSLEFPKETIDQNIMITSTFCELIREGEYQTLIHCSSSEAYGTALYVPMDEGHPEKPLTPYAASKIASDQIVMSYYKTFGNDVAIARPFNAYGPRQNEESYAAIIPLTIQRILAGEAPVIYGDGLQTRDYTYVGDVADALTKVYESDSTRGKTINIATGTEVRIKDIVQMIVKLTGYKGRVRHGPARPGDVRRHVGDISLAKKLLGYSPQTDFETGLKKTIDWYAPSS